jgi:transposase
VNNHELVKIEGRFESDALHILRSVPGVEVVATEQRWGDVQADAVIRSAGRAHHVVVEVKRYANAATAHQLLDMTMRLPRGVGLILIAGNTTAEARRLLEGRGVGVIDGLGNAHIELPGLLVHLEGRRDRPIKQTSAQPPTRLSGKAGIAAQALLLAPERRWKVAELAEIAGISAALAHRVLARLEREEIVAVEGMGPRRTRQLRRPEALLDLWAEEAIDRRVRRVRAFRLSRDPRSLADTVSDALQKAGIEYAVTGAAAALRIAPFVTAVPVIDMWVTDRAELTSAVELAGAELVESGHNLVLAQAEGDGPLAFRAKADDVSIVNRFRLYLDLRADPRRGREQAERLREEVIGF